LSTTAPHEKTPIGIESSREIEMAKDRIGVAGPRQGTNPD